MAINIVEEVGAQKIIKGNSSQIKLLKQVTNPSILVNNNCKISISAYTFTRQIMTRWFTMSVT